MSKLHALPVLLLFGCAEAPDLGERAQACETANKLTANKLTANRLSASAVIDAGLADSDEGRELLTYLVSCALRSTQAITINGETYRGWIGLARDWVSRPLDSTERGWVSACLLSRINAFGVTVPLSLRGRNGALHLTPLEKTTYSLFEGAFWGDVFDGAGDWHACTSGATHPLRVCTLDRGDGLTYCGFIAEGRCDEVCTRSSSGDTAGVECAGRPTMSIYLIPPT